MYEIVLATSGRLVFLLVI